MLIGSFGATRVPFERPVQATAGFVPRSLDTGFVAAEGNPFPQIMAARLARLPGGVHQPLSAEPGVLPASAPTTAQMPPSPAAIKARAARMLPIPLLMTVGMFSPPRAGGLRAGLNPNRAVAAGRAPGI